MGHLVSSHMPCTSPLSVGIPRRRRIVTQHMADSTIISDEPQRTIQLLREEDSIPFYVLQAIREHLEERSEAGDYEREPDTDSGIQFTTGHMDTLHARLQMLRANGND
ncbi:hypothetical protein [Nocardia sp. NPDC052112]|uniref:hypothetical protein n=1 Tax=Nocardia sp. NPDC052112 TaxID=3155646 RepID=UPI003444F386